MSEENLEQVEEVIENHEEPTNIETPNEEIVEEVVEYTPNFNYKVKDEELAFDERLHGSVKSKEDEDYVRELYTKSAGLDTYKEKYATAEGQIEAYLEGYKNLEGLQKSGNLRGVVDTFKFNDDMVLDLAEQILSHRELPEEQRVALEKQQGMERELQELRQQQTSTQENIQSQAMQRDLNELNTLITNDYSSVAQAMKNAGHDMAWEVGVRGHAQFKRDGVEPTIASVVNDVAKAFQYLSPQQQQSAPTLESPQVQQVPVLPNIHGNTSSPIKAKVSSLDDLRKLAQLIPSGR